MVHGYLRVGCGSIVALYDDTPFALAYAVRSPLLSALHVSILWHPQVFHKADTLRRLHALMTMALGVGALDYGADNRGV